MVGSYQWESVDKTGTQKTIKHKQDTQKTIKHKQDEELCDYK